jgi:hypothetical protein
MSTTTDADRARERLRHCLRKERLFLLPADRDFLVRWVGCLAYRDLVDLGLEPEARAIVDAHRVGR